MRTLRALRAANAARLPFQLVKIRFFLRNPKQISQPRAACANLSF